MKFKMLAMDKSLFLFLWVLMFIYRRNGAMFHDRFEYFYLIFYLAMFSRINIEAGFMELAKYRSSNKNELFIYSFLGTLKHTIPLMGLFLLSIVFLSIFNEDAIFLYYSLFYFLFSYLFIVLFTTILNQYFKNKLVLPVILCVAFIQYMFMRMRVVGYEYYPITYPLIFSLDGKIQIVNMWFKLVVNSGILLALYYILGVKADEK